MKTFKNDHTLVEKKTTSVSQNMRNTMLNNTQILITIFPLLYSTSSFAFQLAELRSET